MADINPDSEKRDQEAFEADKKKGNLQISMSDEMALGHYANVVVVAHTETEFTMDFVYLQPQQPKGAVVSRIITSPKHIKQLMSVLQQQLSQFEGKFGEIAPAKPAPPGMVLQ